FNREYTDPRFAALIPVQRPQEAFTPQAVLATIETLNRIERPRSGGTRYEGVQSPGWPDAVFWRPDGPGPDGIPDTFRRLYAFPHLPGVIECALDPFTSPGLRLPWLACYGNHEALIQGVGVITPEVADALVGGRKPVTLTDKIDRDIALETFISGSHAFLAGTHIPLTPDTARRHITRGDFVAAHLRRGGRPDGHGFTDANTRAGTAYYVHDLPGVRLIGRDTTRITGASAGALDVDQLRWLEARLAEVHSGYRTADGTRVTTSAQDRLVVVFSHHGTDTLTNLRGVRAEAGALSEGADVVGGPELVAVLHRFRNVVLWLNGHTHTNRVRPRVDPLDPAHGFWEVTTSAVIDWPCQSRLVEIVAAGRGAMAIACTMLDHDSPLAPAASMGTSELASLHRELAANMPTAGVGSRLEGLAGDRNVVLPLRAPFDLRTLPS
ncbi:MAG TPA: hypothetical protein VHN80_19705, partial [Kineosporiaceae bacterium]|nr:hypothetical protein [Kineosporiaceae bacterium]